MNRLIRISALFILILSGCTNGPESIQENSSTATVFAENVQESTPTETTVEEGDSTKSVEIVGGNEESLREFVKQCLVPIYPSDSSEKMTIYIGSVPKDMPYELPKPEDARIIGSITGGGIDYALIFDTSLSPKSIHEFYAQNLTDQGWHEAPTNGGQGGFISP